MKFLLFLLFILPSAMVCAQNRKTDTQYHRKMPYPRSDFIASLEWTSAPYRYPGPKFKKVRPANRGPRKRGVVASGTFVQVLPKSFDLIMPAIP